MIKLQLAQIQAYKFAFTHYLLYLRFIKLKSILL